MKIKELVGRIEGSYDGNFTFESVLSARASGNMRELNEASLGRVYQHVSKAGEKSWGILTAWRYGVPKSKNLSNMKKLGSQIRSAGLGFFKLTGHWKECQDTNVEYKDCPKDEMVDSVEPSLFVPGISKDDFLKMLKKYNQDAGVYTGPDTDGDAILLFKAGKEMKIGKFHPGKISQAYSKLKGRSFIFEGFNYPAQSHSEAMIEQTLDRC